MQATDDTRSASHPFSGPSETRPWCQQFHHPATIVQHDAIARLATDVADRERVVGVLASRYMASRLIRSIAHASSAPNIALVDAMSLTWLLLMLLVMVVLELLSSRSSLACLAAGGSRGGRRRHFLPSLHESIPPDQMRSYALFRLALMHSCVSITVIHSSRSQLPLGAAHSAVRAMVSPIFPCGAAQVRRAAHAIIQGRFDPSAWKGRFLFRGAARQQACLR